MIKTLPKIYLCLLAVIMSLFVSAGCSRSASPAVSAETNEPKRIISTAPSNTEIIIGLGMGDRLIAVDPYSRDIAGVPLDIPFIDFFYPDTEAVISLEPDLILANEINSFGVADNPFKLLGDLGIRVVEVPTSVSIEGILGDIIFIAETLGVRERGVELAGAMMEDIANIAALAENLPERKKVYFEISSVPYAVSFGNGAYLNEMIEIAGGINIFGDQTGWFSPSAEEIISRNPDIIFTLIYPGEDPINEIKNRSFFESITAIRQNQVYAIDTDSASRPSQNIIKALGEMAGAVNPAYHETAR